MKNLLEIPEEDAFILADTGVFTDFSAEELYDMEGYHNMNNEKIRNAVIHQANAFGFVTKSNTFIIPEVIEELKKYKAILRESQRYFNRNEMDYIKSGKKSQRRRENMELFGEYCMLHNLILRKLRHKIYKPSGQYNMLLRFICSLEDDLGLKPPKRLKPNRPEDGQCHSKTDEKLVAAVLDYSISRRLPSAIISCDCDILRLLTAFSEAIDMVYGDHPAFLYAKDAYIRLYLFNQATGSFEMKTISGDCNRHIFVPEFYPVEDIIRRVL